MITNTQIQIQIQKHIYTYTYTYIYTGGGLLGGHARRGLRSQPREDLPIQDGSRAQSDPPARVHPGAKRKLPPQLLQPRAREEATFDQVVPRARASSNPGQLFGDWRDFWGWQPRFTRHRRF